MGPAWVPQGPRTALLRARKVFDTDKILKSHMDVVCGQTVTGPYDPLTVPVRAVYGMVTMYKSVRNS